MIDSRPPLCPFSAAGRRTRLLAPETGAGGGAPSLVACTPEAADPLARALHAALAQAAPDTPRARLWLERLGGGADWMSARLVWSRGDSPPVSGPILELAVMDAPLSSRLLNDFAAELLRLSNLPADLDRPAQSE